MRIPVLSRRMALEAPQPQSDGAGGSRIVWNEIGHLWCEMRPASGRERADNALPVSRVPYRIITRAAPVGAESRPVAGQRLRTGGRIFAITAVAEFDPDGRYLTCSATEEVAT